MTEQAAALLHKAERSITAADSLLRDDNPDFAAASGVHGAFGEHFVKAGRFDAKSHRWLIDAFDTRIQADYGIEIVTEAVTVTHTIERAREFLVQARRHLAAAS